VLCGFDTRYNPRMASPPERHAVLGRLGIIKGGAEDVFAGPSESRRSFEEASIDNAFESFPLENASSSLIQQVLKAAVSRTALLLLLLIAVSAVGVLGAWWLFRDSGNSEASSPIISEESSDAAGAAAPTAAPTATSTGVPRTVAKRAASIQTADVKTPIQARSASSARPPVTTKPTANASPEAAKSQNQRLDTRTPLSSDVTTAALPLSTDEVASVIDRTLYSKDDEDVRPPQLLYEQLPSPTIGGWTTRTNVIEVIVSETGAVERARFMATPQRMPDTFILSRAKVWNFSPAMKDGRPVRYRLLLSWEVNP
jgi:hypothetical protein